MMWEAGLRMKVSVQMMVTIVMVSLVMRADDHVEATSLRMFDNLHSDGKWAKEEGDVALELTIKTFNASLWASPAPSVIVEFYAHWCPACQVFKPQYERVAKLFNGQDAVYPGVLLLAKVDCAEETVAARIIRHSVGSDSKGTVNRGARVSQINRNLCGRFLVKRYPTILWGKPSKFAWGSRLHQDDQNFVQLQGASPRMNSQTVLDWINTRLEKSYALDPAIQKKQSRQVGNSVSGQVVSIHDIEEATAEAYDIILDEKLVGSSQRAPFVQFLQQLAAHHPSRRCRAGSAVILSNLVDVWPSEHIVEVVEHRTGGASKVHSNLADVVALRQFRICGEDLPRKVYKTCDMATGGYSCGLWYLFHALSVRVDDSESKSAMKAISNFIANFFPCEECRRHFLKMSQSAIDSISTRRDLTLWLWCAHNEVNRRLGNDLEASVEFRSSKVQWPPKAICSACRTSSENAHGNGNEEIEWNEEEVYRFLRRSYGQSIVTVADQAQSLGKTGDGTGYGKDENLTSSAMTAPVGAALGIAMASCGFGVAACCWRLQQKKRKHMRKRGI